MTLQRDGPPRPGTGFCWFDDEHARRSYGSQNLILKRSKGENAVWKVVYQYAAAGPRRCTSNAAMPFNREREELCFERGYIMMHGDGGCSCFLFLCSFICWEQNWATSCRRCAFLTTCLVFFFLFTFSLFFFDFFSFYSIFFLQCLPSEPSLYRNGGGMKQKPSIFTRLLLRLFFFF